LAKGGSRGRRGRLMHRWSLLLVLPLEALLRARAARFVNWNCGGGTCGKGEAAT